MIVELAGCVILDEKQHIYLLHRNKKGITQWELPGGKVESDESAEQAAIRELQEELGVTVTIIRQLGDTQFAENDITYTYVWFLARITDGILHVCEPETFDDIRAFSIDDMADLKLSNNMQQLSKQIIDGNILYKENI